MKPSSRVGLLASFGLLAASLAACTGTVGGSHAHRYGSGTAGTGSGTAGTGSGTAGAGAGPGGSGATAGTGGTVVDPTGGTGGTAPPCVGTCVCVPGIPATTQIPRLTQLQYDTVIKDLLGVTALTSDGNMPPSALLSDDSAGPLTDIPWNGYLERCREDRHRGDRGQPTRSKFITLRRDRDRDGLTTCLTNTIKTFGRKAFRRPLTAAEVTSFLRFNT